MGGGVHGFKEVKKESWRKRGVKGICFHSLGSWVQEVDRKTDFYHVTDNHKVSLT